MVLRQGLSLRRLRCAVVTILLALFAAGTPALAQNHIRAKLVAQTATPAPDRAVTLAILFTPDPGWHGYWQNPGDAGFAGCGGLGLAHGGEGAEASDPAACWQAGGLLTRGGVCIDAPDESRPRFPR